MSETDLSAEEFARWVRAPDALALYKNVDPELRIKAFEARIRSGLLRTAAETARFRGRAPQTLFELVPDNWLQWSPEVDDHFWQTGDTNIPIDTGQQILSAGHWLFDVRFDPDGLRRMGIAIAERPEAAALLVTGPAPTLKEASPPQPIRHAGGAPGKKHWEEMIVEIFRRAFLDNFQPQSQADVVRAMQDWMIENGHDASDESVKQRARMVWPVLKT